MINYANPPFGSVVHTFVPQIRARSISWVVRFPAAISLGDRAVANNGPRDSDSRVPAFNAFPLPRCCAVVTTPDIHLSPFRSRVTLYGERTRTVIRAPVRSFHGYRSTLVAAVTREREGASSAPEVDKRRRANEDKRSLVTGEFG